MTSPTLFGLVLRGRRVVAIGGGRVTTRRVRDLLAQEALVTIIAPRLEPELAEHHQRGALTWIAREYAGPADLQDAWLVHTATGHPQVDGRVSRDAEEARIWCINAGDHTVGSAQMPARGVVDSGHGQVHVAVHASGDPRRAATLRTAVVDHLTSGLVDLRPRRPHTGWVALVGAGPGDDQLLTRRASVLLASADVVVTDRLVPRGLLDMLPEDVRIIDVGKQPQHHPVPQEEINRIIVAEALAGHGVVRFKGGDPYVLGRGGEERLACEEAGVRVEVVPGITSAIAVPAAAGIPVTHRGLARAFTVVTGHEDLPSLPTGADHTLVVLMGVAALRRTARELIVHGRAADCPVAIIEKGCTPYQRVIMGTLADIADRAEEEQIESPSVVIIGSVVKLSSIAAEPRGATADNFIARHLTPA